MQDKATLQHNGQAQQNKNNIEAKVYSELTKILYSHTRNTIWGALLCAICILYGLHHVISYTILVPWLGSVVFVALLRFISATVYFRKARTIEETKYWHGVFLLITVIGGLNWVFAGTYFLSSGPIYQVLITFAIVALAGGSVPLFSPSKVVSSTFLALLFIPFSIGMLLQGNIIAELIGILSFIFLFILLNTSFRIHKIFYETLKLKFENEQLISNLYLTKHKVETINKDFQKEIIERQEIERLLRNSEDQYRLVTDALPVLIAYIDTDLHFRFNNKAYTVWFDKPLHEITGKPIKSILGETEYANFLDHFQELFQGKQVNYETILFFRDHEERYVSVSLIPHMSELRLQGIFSLISDETPRINYLATHDSLTGLANRSLLNARLMHALRYARRSATKVVVMFLDLDHFKNINDTLGHDVGDQLLIKVVERLRNNLYETDTIARLGGDEFIIILDGIKEIKPVIEIAETLCKALSESFKVGGKDLFITTSIGISVFPDDAETIQELLRNADLAMYRAKEHGRNTFEFYTSEMNEVIQKKIMIANSLHNARERKELKIYYQPLINLKENSISALEALLRWNHPELGFISPNEFIPLLEESDQILSIGNWVLENACQQMKTWHKAGFHQLRILVNLSGRQFLKQNMVEVIARVLGETGLQGKELNVELTESLIMGNISQSLKTVKALKALGVTISLDNFGTGYSSLSVLKRFPFDVIKIDQSFIADFTQHPENAAIINAIIRMAHDLNIKVIVEGVEKEEQFAFLKAHDCDEAQGYLFYPPLRAKQVLPVLEQKAAELIPTT